MLEASISSGATASGKRWRRRTGRLLLLAALLIWMGTAYWHTHKPLPDGVRLETQWQTLAQSDSRFIADITTADAYGRPILSHAIFDEVLQVVRSAREFLVLDYFLFNPHQGALEKATAQLVSQALSFGRRQLRKPGAPSQEHTGA